MRWISFLLVFSVIFLSGCVQEEPEITTTKFYLYKMDGTQATGTLFLNGTEQGSGTGMIEVDLLQVGSEYVIRCDMEGTHNQWMLLRHTLYGENKVQKDTTMPELKYLHASHYEGNDIYLIKVPGDWNMAMYGKYLNVDGTGMYAYGGRIAVNIEKDFVDGTVAEDIIKTFTEESEAAQITGDFTEPRRAYSIQYDKNGQMNMALLNIKASGSGIGIGGGLNNTLMWVLIRLPGSDRHADPYNTLEYWLHGHLGTDPVKLMNQQKLIRFTTQPTQKSKFEFTDVMKRLWLLYCQFDAGVKF